MATACAACEGRGFLWGTPLSEAPNLTVVERCDVCERFDSDQAAARAIVVALPLQWYSWGVVRVPENQRAVTVMVAWREDGDEQ